MIGGLVGAGVDPALLGELIAEPSRQAELLAEASKLIGVTLTSGGKPLDAEQNIGRFNPLPMLEEVQSVPMRVFAVDDFPKTPSPNGFKIQRGRLRVVLHQRDVAGQAAAAVQGDA